MSALWSGSTLVTMVVIFLFVGCCCKNKTLARIHKHMKAKLKDESVHLNSELSVYLHLTPVIQMLRYRRTRRSGTRWPGVSWMSRLRLRSELCLR